jgi:hypothetical protein
VYWGPVPVVMALRPAGKGLRAAGVLEEIDRRVQPEEFDRALEAPAHPQAERLAVKARRFIEVLDVDIHQHIHRTTCTGTVLRIVCMTTQ